MDSLRKTLFSQHKCLQGWRRVGLVKNCGWGRVASCISSWSAFPYLLTPTGRGNRSFTFTCLPAANDAGLLDGNTTPNAARRATAWNWKKRTRNSYSASGQLAGAGCECEPPIIIILCLCSHQLQSQINEINAFIVHNCQIVIYLSIFKDKR